eukprot:6331000-Prymnesium_polylepis.1
MPSALVSSRFHSSLKVRRMRPTRFDGLPTRRASSIGFRVALDTLCGLAECGKSFRAGEKMLLLVMAWQQQTASRPAVFRTPAPLLVRKPAPLLIARRGSRHWATKTTIPIRSLASSVVRACRRSNGHTGRERASFILMCAGMEPGAHVCELQQCGSPEVWPRVQPSEPCD